MFEPVKIFSTPEELAKALAEEVLDQIGNYINHRFPFSIALSGGSTPKLLFEILGDEYAENINWKKVHFFWVDERCVPPDHPDSNFGMTYSVFLSRIGINSENIHRIKGEAEPDEEARRYSAEINKYVPEKNDLPCFTLMLLGLGDDGHTASIFPGIESLFSSDKLCETVLHPVTGQKRITLTGNVINNSEKIIFHVTGRNKSFIIEQILGKKDSNKIFPASLVKPVNGSITWFLDEESASLLGMNRNADG